MRQSRRRGISEKDPQPRVLLLLLVIFAAEALVMLTLAALPQMPPGFEVLADPLLLTLILAPFLWWAVVKPLQKAADESRVILRTAMDGFWVVDTQGRFVQVNEAYCQLIGYPHDELLAMRISDIEAAESPEEITARIAGIKQTGSGRFVTRHRRKDGAVLDVEVSANYLPLHGGRFFVFVRDVTDRVQSDKALRDLVWRLNAAEEVGHLGSWELDLSTNHLTWSDEIYRIFGLQPQEFGASYQAFLDSVHPEDRAAVDAAYAGSLRDNRDAYEIEHRVVRKHTGEVRQVHERCVHLRDAAGTIIRSIGMVHDITERKEAEAVLARFAEELEERVRQRTAALAASERRFTDLFESAPDATVITNREGIITLVNGQAERIFGWTRAELVGQPVERLMPQKDRAAHVGLRERYLRSSAAPRAMGAGRALRAVRKDGTEFPVEISLSPMPSNGEVFVAATVRDISERKQLEAQLLQAQKMETVGQLAGGIAHDFNNLITVINTTAELAAMSLGESDPILAELSTIRDAGARAAGLTGQLLAFSRKQILQPSVVNLNTVVANVEAMLRRVIGEQITVAIQPGRDLANVLVDPGQIEQVIVNLAINSRDAMPTGGTLTIETGNVLFDETYVKGHQGTRPGPYVVLAISDTGIGMDEATRQRIFEPFFTTKGPGEGTGLGLSTAYGIIKQSGGDIWVYSEVGKGTTFKVYLPRVDQPARGAPAASPGVPARGTETILVVEDEETLRRVARRILESAGYRVLVAASGEEALGLLSGHHEPVHLLLTDVVMPGMSGRDLAERLGVSHPAMKLLYTSGYTDDAIVHHGVLDQGVHFLAKPYMIADLTRKVREVLDS